MLFFTPFATFVVFEIVKNIENFSERGANENLLEREKFMVNLNENFSRKKRGKIFYVSLLEFLGGKKCFQGGVEILR